MYTELYLDWNTIIPTICCALCSLLHPDIDDLRRWGNPIHTNQKKFPGLYTTFCLVLLQNTWVCSYRMNGRWLATEVWIPMVLNSTFSYTLLQRKSIFSLLLRWGRPDQSGARAAEFYRPPLSFCSLIFRRWYPASVSLKWCLFWQPCSAVFSAYKVRSYQTCFSLNSNKLAVTFWVHCF